MLLTILSDVCPDIQCLSADNIISEDLTAVLQYIKFGRCGLGGIWDTNSCPLCTPGDIIAEGVSVLFYPTS